MLFLQTLSECADHSVDDMFLISYADRIVIFWNQQKKFNVLCGIIYQNDVCVLMMMVNIIQNSSIPGDV